VRKCRASGCDCTGSCARTKTRCCVLSTISSERWPSACAIAGTPWTLH